MKHTRPGLKGLTNEEDIKDFILLLLLPGDMKTLTIFFHCHREFGTTDNQIRSLLIRMMREGLVRCTDRWSYELTRGSPLLLPKKTGAQVYERLLAEGTPGSDWWHTQMSGIADDAPDGYWVDDYGDPNEVLNDPTVPPRFDDDGDDDDLPDTDWDL